MLNLLQKKKTLNRMRIIISGGGTGGHVFPAIAIADAIKKKHPEAEIRFVGAKGKLEMEKVPKAGYEIDGLWISGFQRKLSWALFSFPIKLVSSLLKAGKILRKFRPDVAAESGGHAKTRSRWRVAVSLHGLAPHRDLAVGWA